ELVERDLAARMKPLAVVASCGTTSTASVDSTAAIAEICREYKIWLHVDAAYGGGLALLPEEKWITDGWADADSLVINPHKMLFVPLDFSVLYVRDLERLRRVFTLVPEYLRGDTGENASNLDTFNSEIVDSVNRSGRAYLNQTKLRGRIAIRLGLGNVLTTEKHLRDGWELIQETARSIASGARSKSPAATPLG